MKNQTHLPPHALQPRRHRYRDYYRRALRHSAPFHIDPLERRVLLTVAIGPDVPAEFAIGTTVASADTQNFGANIQNAQFNNLTTDPGFEPIITRIKGNATGGGANFILNDQGDTTSFDSTVTDGFFNGATARIYRVVDGAMTLIRTDTVAQYDASQASGYQIILASDGTPIQAGDVYFLDLVQDNAPIASVDPRLTSAINGDTWYWLGNDGISTSRDSSTTAPVDGGQTSLKMVNGGPSQFSIQQYDWGNLASGYKQLTPGTTYRVSVWLKQDGLATPDVSFHMDGAYSSVQHTFNGITGDWQQYTYDFVAPAYPTSDQILQSVLSFSGAGTLWVDNLLVYNPTYGPFQMQPQAAQLLQNYHPGTLRIWSGQTNTSFGNTLANWTDPDAVNELSWDPNFGRTPAPLLHLPTALALAKQVGANPWLIVGVDFDESEWQGLIEYLAGAAGTPYADKRIAQGHAAPWTEDFSDIYIEFGNETWNSLFNPWIFSDGTQYGQFAQHFFEAMKSDPAFAAVASKIHFVLGGWDLYSGTSGYGAMAMQACPDASILAVSSYIGGITTVSSANFQTTLLFVPNAGKAVTDADVATQTTLAGQGRSYELAIYESGPDYSLPNPNVPFDPQQEQIGKSLAAGVATLDDALYQSYVGYVADNYFTFQSGNNWASNSSVANGSIPYPSWLALQMRNQFASGDMLQTNALQTPTSLGTDLNGDNTYRPLTSVYAFRDGDNYSVIVLSLKLTGSTQVTLDLPFSSASSVSLHTLTGNPTANNLTEDDISIQTGQASKFSQHYTLTIPAGSVYVYDFSGTSTAGATPTLPLLSVAATTPSATEVFQSGKGIGIVTFTRTGPTAAPLTIFYNVSGTPNDTVNYQFLTGTAIIPAGKTSVTVPVIPFNNLARTGAISVTLTAAADASYTLGVKNSATVTIADNNLAPISFAGLTFNATISSGNFSFASKGTYQLYFSASGNGFARIGGTGVDSAVGTFTYTRTGSSTATVIFPDAIHGDYEGVLTFSSATAATLVLTENFTTHQTSKLTLLAAPKTSFAPASLSGRSGTEKISAATGALATGSEIVIFAQSSNHFITVGTAPLPSSIDTFTYEKFAPNLAILSFTGTSSSGFTTLLFTAATKATLVTTFDASGATQRGTLALDPIPAATLVPSSLDGESLAVTISAGKPPFAAKGASTINLAASSYSFTQTTPVAASTGTYAYEALTPTLGYLHLDDSVTGDSLALLNFTATAKAAITIASLTTPTGSQRGVATLPPDFLLAAIGKSVAYVQSSAAKPGTPQSGVAGEPGINAFLASITPAASQLIAGAAITGPHASVASLSGNLDTSNGYASQSTLDAAYPNGAYALTIDTTHFGTQKVSLTLSGNKYPTAPFITNFLALQTLHASAWTTVQWTKMAGGAATDFIQLVILDPANNNAPVFTTPDQTLPGALTGTDTSVTIPGGTLLAGHQYVGELRFYKVTSRNTTAVPGATIEALYGALTDFAINTLA